VNTAVDTNSLELVGVTSGYGTTTILRNVDLAVPAGSVTALLGSNGAGKSTLLKTVSGLVRPTQGTVRLGGEDITHLPTNQRAKRGLCHIPEGRAIFRHLTVRENLLLQAGPGHEAELIERCTQAFPILGERLNQRAGSMSGGQQQMLAMCRAYAHNPKLILVDEASLGLAPILVDEIFLFLRKVADEGAALLIVDQFITRALALATKVYVMNRGEMVFSGSPAELEKDDVFNRYLGAD
jgi:branched-chain amino acid transport system ATP-binding protein